MEIKKSKLKLSKNLILLLLAFSVIFTGCKKDEYIYIQTDNSLPTAKFSYTIDNLTVTFTNESNDATAYAWDFGDGSSSDVFSPEHEFAAKGVYSVSLTATDGNGETETMTAEIAVGYPVATFTYVVDLKTVTFTNTSANATSYLWDFGDGNTSTEENPVHTYASVDTYTVTLTAIDGTDDDTYSEDVTTLDKLEVVIIDWDMNVDTDGFSTRGCGFANSSDSYDLDDGAGKSTKIDFSGDDMPTPGDDLYQVVNVSANAEYDFSFWVYQKSTAGDETGAVVGTIETVVDGGATPGTILATVPTTTTTTKVWNNFTSGLFNTGANTQVVIRFFYDANIAPAGQIEARVDYVEMN